MNPDIVRVFVGCDPNDCDLEQMMVLEHTMRKHASLPVEIHWMRLSRNPQSFWYSDPRQQASGWRTERWATPFSGFRWAVPAHCGYQGRAIYMDTDMIVMSDIAELWRTPLAAPAVFAARRETGFQRFCVMLWDCAAARSVLPGMDELRSQPDAHSRLTRHFAAHPGQVQAMDPAFNNIDGDGQPVERIKILHYSDMGTQFSHRYSLPRLEAEGGRHWFDGKLLAHPRGDLAERFEHEYQDALASGRRLDQYRNPEPYGVLVKKSERHYSGNPVTRGLRGWFGLRPH
ncbi:MAG: glycosyl transferase [Hydrocarboniphaga sp.]|uniref:glycosyl transferase n=1 Tax=Hydrocarboniphaga sp. TaxID=2033016 RepID=UPI00261AC965|nr:glycosyl transferase [Hydrocarboniphaga sp.]MDB5968153.1 glycosyl transferase [Hydrocarboniphaga sp.]